MVCNENRPEQLIVFSNREEQDKGIRTKGSAGKTKKVPQVQVSPETNRSVLLAFCSPGHCLVLGMAASFTVITKSPTCNEDKYSRLRSRDKCTFLHLQPCIYLQ